MKKPQMGYGHIKGMTYLPIPNLLLGLFLFSVSVQGSGAIAGLILLSRRHKDKAALLVQLWGVSLVFSTTLALWLGATSPWADSP